MEQLAFKSLLIRFGFDDILPEFQGNRTKIIAD